MVVAKQIISLGKPVAPFKQLLQYQEVPWGGVAMGTFVLERACMESAAESRVLRGFNFLSAPASYPQNSNSPPPAGIEDIFPAPTPTPHSSVPNLPLRV